jgi:hypothetical protein
MVRIGRSGTATRRCRTEGGVARIGRAERNRDVVRRSGKERGTPERKHDAAMRNGKTVRKGQRGAVGPAAWRAATGGTG